MGRVDLVKIVAGLILAIVGLSFLTTSINMPRWLKRGAQERGLFEACVSSFCWRIMRVGGDVLAVRTALFLGLASTVAGIGLALLCLIFYCAGKTGLMKLILVLAFLACEAATFLIVVGLVIYLGFVFGEVKKEQYPALGHAFAIAIFGCIFLAGGGGVFFVCRKSFDED